MDYSDWLQELMGITVLASEGKIKADEAKIVKARLQSILSKLEDVEAKDKHGNLIVKVARLHLLAKLKGRFQSHFDHMNAHKAEADALRIDLRSTSDEERLGQIARNFHHRAYYALFLAIRYFLVSKGLFDAPERAKLTSGLAELKVLEPSLADNVDDLAAYATKLSGLREKSDYVMGAELDRILFDDPTMSQSVTIVTNSSRLCGVRT